MIGGDSDRVPRPLVLGAHGSADPRFAHVVDELARLVRVARPHLEVRVGYLDHGVSIESVTDASCVVVPLLLSTGYHAQLDLPKRAAGDVTPAVGPQHRLITVLVDRLREAGWAGQAPVALAAIGSKQGRAVDDVRRVARTLGAELGAHVTPAFLADGEPRLADVEAAAIASYLIAPGRFHDEVVATGAPIIAAPIGAHPLVAEATLARYDQAIARPSA